MTDQDIFVARLKGKFYVTTDNLEETLKLLREYKYLTRFYATSVGKVSINFTIVDGYQGESELHFKVGEIWNILETLKVKTERWKLMAYDKQ